MEGIALLSMESIQCFWPLSTKGSLCRLTNNKTWEKTKEHHLPGQSGQPDVSGMPGTKATATPSCLALAPGIQRCAAFEHGGSEHNSNLALHRLLCWLSAVANVCTTEMGARQAQAAAHRHHTTCQLHWLRAGKVLLPQAHAKGMPEAGRRPNEVRGGRIHGQASQGGRRG